MKLSIATVCLSGDLEEKLDAGGIVKSQVVQSAGGEIRLVLNASQSSRTLSSRFLSEFFGSGVQHIAFATDDIFATVASLRGKGVGLLEIPENYYDDLEAKTDLTAAAIDRLRDNNILYERDDGAEFLQVYTQAFDGRFFFAIVERRGGYKGFGASNAQIRLTAQAREANKTADFRRSRYRSNRCIRRRSIRGRASSVGLWAVNLDLQAPIRLPHAMAPTIKCRTVEE